MKAPMRLLCGALILAVASMAFAEGEGDDKSANKRDKIDARSAKILEQVLSESAKAAELFENAIGYAVFDNTKAALGISGGGGSGVAEDKKTGKRT